MEQSYWDKLLLMRSVISTERILKRRQQKQEKCLEVARSYSSEEIHFISGNTRDFADENDKEKLHPDMLADLAEMNIPETRFFYLCELNKLMITEPHTRDFSRELGADQMTRVELL